MKISYLLAAGAALAWSSSSAMAAGFVNGGFEDGNAGSWTQGGGNRSGVLNSSLNPSNFIPGDGGTRSAVVTNSTSDGHLAQLGDIVYSGNYSFRVENTASGGFASVIQQRVNNYTDANIFFAWKAVLENGGHSANESALMLITLRDLTDSVDVISRIYNAGANGVGVDNRFLQTGSFFYTPQWQIEQLAIDASLSGHDFLLSVLAADCQPTGHEGYVYLDGFGAVTPPPVDPSAVPEPATWAMMLAGFGLVGGALRRRRTSVSFA